jgi:uncharacterized protein (DUF2147 family)
MRSERANALLTTKTACRAASSRITGPSARSLLKKFSPVAAAARLPPAPALDYAYVRVRRTRQRPAGAFAGRKSMLRTVVLALGAGFLITNAALADPIDGRWKTDAGSTAQISPCGGSFCIKLITGEHAGRQIGQMAASGAGTYKGKITDPANDKTYSGDAALTGDRLKMRGCVMGFFCRSQNWQRL